MNLATRWFFRLLLPVTYSIAIAIVSMYYKKYMMAGDGEYRGLYRIIVVCFLSFPLLQLAMWLIKLIFFLERIRVDRYLGPGGVYAYFIDNFLIVFQRGLYFLFGLSLMNIETSLDQSFSTINQVIRRIRHVQLVSRTLILVYVFFALLLPQTLYLLIAYNILSRSYLIAYWVIVLCVGLPLETYIVALIVRVIKNFYFKYHVFQKKMHFQITMLVQYASWSCVVVQAAGAFLQLATVIELKMTNRMTNFNSHSDWYGAFMRIVSFYLAIVQTAQILLTLAIVRQALAARQTFISNMGLEEEEGAFEYVVSGHSLNEAEDPLQLN